MEQRSKSDALMAFMYAPFKVSRVLELLYAFNWLFLTILAMLPREYVRGTLEDRTVAVNQNIIILICFIITFASLYGLWANSIFVRRLVLLINLSILLLISGVGVLRFPISTGSGFIIILSLLTMFTFWRIDKTR